MYLSSPEGPVGQAVPVRRLRAAYRRHTRAAGGRWTAMVTCENMPAVMSGADEVVDAQSVNKVALATAVLADGGAGLADRIDVAPGTVMRGGDGIFALTETPGAPTLALVLAALLTVSDDTAVRICAGVLAPERVNDYLARQGFTHTRVEPAGTSLYLGQTTARETCDLLLRLSRGDLLSPAHTAFVLGALRSPIAATDGVRQRLTSPQRSRIAAKAGWYADSRTEAGLVFDGAGTARVAYAFFADGLSEPANFGSNHPAVRARAAIGPHLLALAPDES